MHINTMEAPREVGVNNMFNMIPLPYRILAVIIVALSLFGFGYYKGLQVSKERIALFEAKAKAEYETLRAAYEKAKNSVNEKIVTEYVDKIIYVTKWRTRNVTVVETVPSNCELSNGWVHVHNSSAEGRDADSAAAADGASSGIKDTEALATVVDNYGICAANAEKVKAWQNWYTEQQGAVGKINRDNKVPEEINIAEQPTNSEEQK
jgi:hypothetical protein